jgi:hypothetical protein
MNRVFASRDAQDTRASAFISSICISINSARRQHNYDANRIN